MSGQGAETVSQKPGKQSAQDTANDATSQAHDVRSAATSVATLGVSGRRLSVRTAIEFGLEDDELADERDLQLLGHVQRLGSITAAARAAGVTYKTAWDRLRKLQDRLGHVVIIAAKGGRGGGKTVLSEKGQALLQYYEQLRKQQDHAVEPDVALDAVGALAERPLPLRKTSARNHLQGAVTAIERRGIRDTISVSVHDTLQLSLNITHASTIALGLKKGMNVYLLIKAPSIQCAHQQQALPNVFCGVVRHARRVQTQQELEVQVAPNVHLVTVTEPAQTQPLRKGEQVWLYIDPDNVILGVD